MKNALRLDELCKAHKREVDKWKKKAEGLDCDRQFLEDQIKGARRRKISKFDDQQFRVLRDEIFPNNSNIYSTKQKC